ncbi:MAG: hypothetical protein WCI11_19940 [Candidatus Methylumidiphilus sp.]
MNQDDNAAPLERRVRLWSAPPWWIPVGAPEYQWGYSSNQERADEAEIFRVTYSVATLRYFIKAWAFRLCPAYRRWNNRRVMKKIEA